MKARLNVLGNKMKVTAINFYSDKVTSAQIVDENGDLLTFHDENSGANLKDALTINLQEAFEFPDMNREYVVALNDLLEQSEQYLLELQQQIIQEVLNHGDMPFGDCTFPNLVKEYKGHKEYIDGVASALEVVKGSV
ncbi:hypothetical protein [Lysinibacillus sphaericus]|uniref:hypothetical protein n=1 Tax=Lysinibacillus sphaericus TaxID=1421 RepID=UPI003D04118A